jgi:hypothetical protein
MDVKLLRLGLRFLFLKLLDQNSRQIAASRLFLVS